MRTFLYRKDFQDGKIFNEDQIADALHDGWVDDPSNITESSKAAEAARPDVGKPAKPKAAVTPKKDVLTMTVPVARVAIMKEKIVEALRAILAREQTRERGPRVGVIDAVEERIGELETS